MGYVDMCVRIHVYVCLHACMFMFVCLSGFVNNCLPIFLGEFWLTSVIHQYFVCMYVYMCTRYCYIVT